MPISFVWRATVGKGGRDRCAFSLDLVRALEQSLRVSLRVHAERFAERLDVRGHLPEPARVIVVPAGRIAKGLGGQGGQSPPRRVEPVT